MEAKRNRDLYTCEPLQDRLAHRENGLPRLGFSDPHLRDQHSPTAEMRPSAPTSRHKQNRELEAFGTYALLERRVYDLENQVRALQQAIFIRDRATQTVAHPYEFSRFNEVRPVSHQSFPDGGTYSTDAVDPSPLFTGEAQSQMHEQLRGASSEDFVNDSIHEAMVLHPWHVEPPLEFPGFSAAHISYSQACPISAPLPEQIAKYTTELL